MAAAINGYAIPWQCTTILWLFDNAGCQAIWATAICFYWFLMGVGNCGLPGFKCREGCAAAPRSHLGHSHLVLWGFETAACQASNAAKAAQRLLGAICEMAAAINGYTIPWQCTTILWLFDTAACQAIWVTAICFYQHSMGVRNCRLPGFKCRKGCAAAPRSHLGHSHLLL